MQRDPLIGEAGLAFAHALVDGEFDSAHRMLTESLRRIMPVDELREHYQSMISYTQDPPDTIKVGQQFPPGETDGIPDGLGWVFVDIDCLNSSNDGWLESVGVLITDEDSRFAISQIVWGRP